MALFWSANNNDFVSVFRICEAYLMRNVPSLSSEEAILWSFFFYFFFSVSVSLSLSLSLSQLSLSISLYFKPPVLPSILVLNLFLLLLAAVINLSLLLFIHISNSRVAASAHSLLQASRIPPSYIYLFVYIYIYIYI